jgi:hypothetical protein
MNAKEAVMAIGKQNVIFVVILALGVGMRITARTQAGGERAQPVVSVYASPT